MARLSVKVTDASTGAALPYTFVSVDGLSDSTGLDGAVQFEVALGKTVVVKARHSYYRPFTMSVVISADSVPVEAKLERATL